MYLYWKEPRQPTLGFSKDRIKFLGLRSRPWRRLSGRRFRLLHFHSKSCVFRDVSPKKKTRPPINSLCRRTVRNPFAHNGRRSTRLRVHSTRAFSDKTSHHPVRALATPKHGFSLSFLSNGTLAECSDRRFKAYTLFRPSWCDNVLSEKRRCAGLTSPQNNPKVYTSRLLWVRGSRPARDVSSLCSTGTAHTGPVREGALYLLEVEGMT